MSNIEKWLLGVIYWVTRVIYWVTQHIPQVTVIISLPTTAALFVQWINSNENNEKLLLAMLISLIICCLSILKTIERSDKNA